MVEEPGEVFPRRFRLARIRLNPGVNEWSNQPPPDRSLVVRAVARTQVAVVARLVIRMLRIERPQPDWRQQPAFHRIEYCAPTGLVEHRVLQREGKNLIRPARGV